MWLKPNTAVFSRVCVVIILYHLKYVVSQITFFREIGIRHRAFRISPCAVFRSKFILPHHSQPLDLKLTSGIDLLQVIRITPGAGWLRLRNAFRRLLCCGGYGAGSGCSLRFSGCGCPGLGGSCAVRLSGRYPIRGGHTSCRAILRRPVGVAPRRRAGNGCRCIGCCSRRERPDRGDCFPFAIRHNLAGRVCNHIDGGWNRCMVCPCFYVRALRFWGSRVRNRCRRGGTSGQKQSQYGEAAGQQLVCLHGDSPSLHHDFTPIIYSLF